MNEPIAPDRIGRFSRAELEAMRGKRGRKPAEYFELFPDLKREPAPRAAARVEESAPVSTAAACAEPRLAYETDPLVVRLALASPEVRQLIGNLLDLLDVPHRGVAMVDRPSMAIALPATCAVGDAGIPIAASDAVVVVEPPVAPEPVYKEPVYADPEADAAQVAEDEALGLAG